MEMNMSFLENITIDNSLPNSELDMDKAMEKYNKEKQFKLNRDMGLPIKYDDYNFSNIDRTDTEFAKIVSKLENWVTQFENGNKKSLVFSGTYGSGKTLLSTVLCKKLKGHFVRSSFLINEIKQGFSFNSKETANEIIARYGSYPLLVIDEVGRGQNDTDLLFQVINENIENGNCLILVSNLSVADLCKMLGNAFADRLHDFAVINFTNTSYRGNK